MIKSMTSFARTSLTAKEDGWVVEIRSVNHRFFEFSVRTPSSLSSLEAKIREFVQGKIKRGKVTLNISQDNGAKKHDQLFVDEEAAKFYTKSVQELKKKFKLEGELLIGDLLKMPGLFTTEPQAVNPEKVWPSLKRAIDKTLTDALKARSIEGAKLAKDMTSRLDTITKSAKAIERLAKNRTSKVFAKISEKVDALIGDKDLDADRIHREVAFMAERTDITEELVRLDSHLSLFKEKLKEDKEVGRELDFICQEMNREINTISSKSQLFEIATEVIAVKGELEKIREQVQNIE